MRAIRSVGEGAWSMEGGGGVVEGVARCHATGLSGRRSAAMVNVGTCYDSHHMVLYMCTLGPVQSRLEYRDARRNGRESELFWAFGNTYGASFRMSSHW